MALRVSPSTLGNFFFLDCERMLRFAVTPKDCLQQEGVPAESASRSIVTETIIERGRTWEESVVKERLGGRVTTGPADSSMRLCERVLSYEQVLALLREAPADHYLYQSHLEPPENFYRRYGIARDRIVFSPCRPDLIYLQNGSATHHRRLSLTDIKASHHTKFSHRLQTAMYALMLRDIVETEKLDHCQVDMDRCDIWLLDEEKPESWDMAKVLAPLEEFLRERLPGILLQPASEARWSLSPACEWCGYLDHCRQQADESLDVSLLPYFAKEAKHFLAKLPHPVRTLPELAQFLENPAAAQLCRGCGALSGSHERLKADVKAMLSRQKNDKGLWRGGEVIPYGGPSLALPKGQHVGVVITLQQDPVANALFAAGIHVQGGRALGVEDKPWTTVARRPTAEEHRRVGDDFLARLEQIMAAVHEHNSSSPEWGEQKSLQCYVYDRYERKLLDELLECNLSAPEQAERALSLFCYFHTERPTSDTWHSGNEIPFPILVVTEAIAELVAMPSPVSYKLTTTSLLLKPEKYASFYSAKGDYAFPFCNRLRTDPLLAAWNAGRQDEIDSVCEDIGYELEKRLKATFSVLAGLRERVGDSLIAYPPKFFLPARSGIGHPLLARLAFMMRYEGVMSYLSIHATRTAERARMLEKGDALCVELRMQSQPGIWQAELGAESEHVIPEANGYLEWLLTADDEDGNCAQMCFADYWYRDQMWVPKKCAVCFAAVEDVFAHHQRRFIRLRVESGNASPELIPGRRYLLYERYTDFTSRRVVNALQDLDRQGDGLFLSLIGDPHQTLQKRRRPKQVKTARALDAFLAGFTFTPSQKVAFTRVLDTNFQLLWGPPGTGKTHFLCMMAMALCALAESEGKTCTILVTAFTHAAIENCLRMCDRLAHGQDLLAQPLRISKVGGWRSAEEAARIDCPDAWSVAEDCHQVVGATIFAIANDRKFPPRQKFDVVIIDEGSQLKVAEAAIAIERVERVRGRFVIAGDDKQLGPIIHAAYPPAAANEPYLFASIFDCLRGPDLQRNEYTAQLCECFRMNDTLCQFPAVTLYGKEFQPATPEIGGRRLALVLPAAAPLAADSVPAFTAPAVEPTPPPEQPATRAAKVRVVEPLRARKVRILDEPKPEPGPKPKIDNGNWLEWVLQPAYPLAMLVLQDFFALAENRLEASLVADLAVFLRDHLQTGGQGYADDADFWQRGLFIVSPHHVQIQAIHQALCERRRWDYPPFVETVNKMQGQESESVIVSYGVSDVDYALQEGEFIYSLERLNVALTRARSKAIVCLPYNLLHPPLAAFARPELLAGLDFMLQLRDFVWQQGERAEFTVPWQGREVKLLAGRRKT